MMKMKLYASAMMFALVACGGGGENTKGGFLKGEAPELILSMDSDKILPNPSGARYESLSSNAKAMVQIYAKQNDSYALIEDDGIIITINDKLSTVKSTLFCFESDNDSCSTEVENENGDKVTVLKPGGNKILTSAAGFSRFAVTATEGKVGQIGVNVKVTAQNGSVGSKDIVIPVEYNSSGVGQGINIFAADIIRPNQASKIVVNITDEAGNPVPDSEANNLIVTATNLDGTVLGFNGASGLSVNANTTNGAAEISVLANKNGYLTLTAQTDADNDIDNGIKNLLSASRTIQVSDTVVIPTGNIAITTGAAPNGVVDALYNGSVGGFTIETSGSPAADISLDSGDLPPGISFNSGILSGIPTVVGEYEFTVKATGANGTTDVKDLKIKITDKGFVFEPAKFAAIKVTRNDDPNKSDVCSAQGQVLTLVPEDGYTMEPPFTWKMGAGGVQTAIGADKKGVRVVSANGIDLPDLYFTVTGNTQQVTLNGLVCPTAPDEVFTGHAIILTATDANGVSFQSVLPLIITREIMPFEPEEPEVKEETLKDGKVGESYAEAIKGSTASSFSSGQLPPGLTLANGFLSGTPTAAGSYVFSITEGTTTRKIIVVIKP